MTIFVVSYCTKVKPIGRTIVIVELSSGNCFSIYKLWVRIIYLSLLFFMSMIDRFHCKEVVDVIYEVTK